VSTDAVIVGIVESLEAYGRPVEGVTEHATV
jgi:hypothetical protein